jgi:hypothetical protein
MYDLPHRLWIAISLATVAFGFIAPAFAKPQPLASVVTSQPTDRSAPKKSNGSAIPLDAVLANVRVKPSSPKIRRGVNHQPPTRSTRVKNVETTTDRSLQGISHLTDPDRNAQKTNVSAVNRLIN